MSVAEPTVEVMLKLPKDIYERAAHIAANERQRLEDTFNLLIADGLESHASVRQILEGVSEKYRARLAREGKLQQSSEDLLEDLRKLRERIARELYPQ